jgi:hypothetical protein
MGLRGLRVRVAIVEVAQPSGRVPRARLATTLFALLPGELDRRVAMLRPLHAKLVFFFANDVPADVRAACDDFQKDACGKFCTDANHEVNTKWPIEHIEGSRAQGALRELTKAIEVDRCVI